MAFIDLRVCAVLGVLGIGAGLCAPVAAQETGIEPGVYAWFDRIGAVTKDDTARIVEQCATAPHIHYPDGFMAFKRLDVQAAESGEDAYSFVGHGTCEFADGTMSCDVARGAPADDVTLDGQRVADYKRNDDGDVVLVTPDDEPIGIYVACDLEQLDQAVEERNALDEIVKRPDGGPVPVPGATAES